MSIKKKNKKSELDKLEQYLKKKKIKYERIDKNFEDDGSHYGLDQHKIIAFDLEAVCQYGSYGYEQGLLECSEEGWLTAREVIGMYERRAG